MDGTKIMIKPGEHIDDIGMGNYKVIQGDGFSYGVDSVLIAAFASGETGATKIKYKQTVNGGRGCVAAACSKEGRLDYPESTFIADLGTGNGVIPFIIAHKIKEAAIIGVEKNRKSIDRAERGLHLNRLDERIRLVESDIKDFTPGDICNEDEFIRIDAVVSNPPYFKRGSGIPNDDSDKFTARHETTATIADFAECAGRILQNGGDFYLIHRPSRLPDIIEALRTSNLEPKEMQFVVPRRGEPANMVMIHAIKGARPEMKLLPEIPVYRKDGSDYSDIIKMIYERD